MSLKRRDLINFDFYNQGFDRSGFEKVAFYRNQQKTDCKEKVQRSIRRISSKTDFAEKMYIKIIS